MYGAVVTHDSNIDDNIDDESFSLVTSSIPVITSNNNNNTTSSIIRIRILGRTIFTTSIVTVSLLLIIIILILFSTNTNNNNNNNNNPMLGGAFPSSRAECTRRSNESAAIRWPPGSRRTSSPSSKSVSMMGHDELKLDSAARYTTSGHASTARMCRSPQEWLLTCTTMGGAARRGRVYIRGGSGHGSAGYTAPCSERQSEREASSATHCRSVLTATCSGEVARGRGARVEG